MHTIGFERVRIVEALLSELDSLWQQLRNVYILWTWLCHTLKFNGTHVLEVAFISVDCGQWRKIYKFSSIHIPTLHDQLTHIIVGILIDWLILFATDTIQGVMTQWYGMQIRQIWVVSPPYDYPQGRPFHTYRMRNCRIEGIQVEEDLWKISPPIHLPVKTVSKVSKKLKSPMWTDWREGRLSRSNMW